MHILLLWHLLKEWHHVNFLIHCFLFFKQLFPIWEYKQRTYYCNNNNSDDISPIQKLQSGNFTPQESRSNKDLWEVTIAIKLYSPVNNKTFS